MDERAKFEEWVRQCQASFDDTVQLFWNRKLFRAVNEMFQTNQGLSQSGQHVWQWLAGMYVRDAAMLIRRELDKQRGALNLRHLLHDIEGSIHVLHAQSRAGGLPSADDVRRDRETLEQDTERVRDYAERLPAHRTPAAALSVTWTDLDRSVNAVLRTMRRYRGYLTATDLLQVTPVANFDWLAPFRIRWKGPTLCEPDDDEDSA